MTCIVAIRDPRDGSVMVGADRRVVDGAGMKVNQAKPKIWTHGGAIIGVAGSARACTVVQQTLSGSRRRSRRGATALDFAMILQDALVGAEVYDPDHYDDTAFDVLIVAHNEIIWLDTQGAIVEIDDDVFALGSGGSYALGSLYGTRAVSVPGFGPREHITFALDAATRWDTATGDDVDILQIHKVTPKVKTKAKR